MKRLLLPALLFWSIPLRAEGPLSWEQCVGEAAANNPSLRAARAAVERSEAQARSAWSPFLPQVTLSAGVDRSKGGGKTFSDGLAARQNLFNGFADKAALSRTRADLDSTRAGLDDALAQAGADLRSAFALNLFSQQQAALSSAIAKRRRENLRLVDLRFQGGQENKGAYLKTRASNRQALFEESQAARDLRVSQRRLAKALGRDPFQEISAAGTLGAELPAGEPDFRALAAETPAVRQAGAQVRAAGASVASARSGYYPSVSVDGRTGRSGGTWPPEEDQWSAGAGLSWSIFSGGSTAGASAAAQAQREQARAALEDARARAALALEDAYASLQDAVERVEVQKEFLAAAEVRAEIARAQYNNGLLSFQDWDVIENDLISSQKAFLSSRRDAVSALADWERTLGKGALPS